MLDCPSRNQPIDESQPGNAGIILCIVRHQGPGMDKSNSGIEQIEIWPRSASIKEGGTQLSEATCHDCIYIMDGHEREKVLQVL